MKPPFAYYGGKSGLARQIVDLLAPHRVYIEPFAGSLAVLFAKPRARHEIVNDLDANVATFFRVLRDRPDDLAAACALTPHARDEYDNAALDPEVDDIERARRFWVRVNQSFAKTAGEHTGWSVTTSRTQSVPASILARLGRFAAVAERLMHCTIECCDAADLVDRLATPDTAIYADPPYLASTRRSRDRQRPADYAHDMGEEAEHRRLAEVLTSTPAAVILSGYPSPLYDQLYAGWHRLEVPVTVRSSNRACGSGTRGARTEVLWSNRPLDHGRLFGASS